MITEFSPLTQLGVATLQATTPLLLAALGALVAERSGVRNIALEGIMLLAALSAFAAALTTGSPWLGLASAVATGIALALLLALLTLYCATHQLLTGLVVLLFASGLSGYLGQPFSGRAVTGLPTLERALLPELPDFNALLFGHDLVVYLSWGLFLLVVYLLAATRWGLVLRAAGESPQATQQLGYPVRRIRLAALLFSGAMGGLAGGYLVLAITPIWSNDLTSGRGWLALGLVIIAAWRPGWLLLAAHLLGASYLLPLYLPKLGVALSPFLLATAPYGVTLLALTLVALLGRRRLLRLAPAALGQPFQPLR